MNNTIPVALTIGALLFGLTATSEAIQPTLEPATSHSAGTVGEPDLSGSIRLYSGSWATISDAGHTPTGFGQIETLADRVRVHYDFPVTSVSSVQVTPDEAFTAAGVRLGASVGLNHVDILFYMGTSQTPVNPALLTRAGANVWITGFFL